MKFKAQNAIKYTLKYQMLPIINNNDWAKNSQRQTYLYSAIAHNIEKPKEVGNYRPESPLLLSEEH